MSEVTLQFTESEYLEAMEGCFGSEEEVTHCKYSFIKKTRKEHECLGSGTAEDHTETIQVGSPAIRESAIHTDLGRVSCYVCIPCMKDVLTGGLK